MSDTQPKGEQKTTSQAGNLAVTLATWLFILDQAGHQVEPADLRAAIRSLREAGEDEADPQGQALVALIESRLGQEPDHERVRSLLDGLFGTGRIMAGFGQSREERLHQVRSYQFKSSLPWIARIIDRFPDGSVGSHWVMVERVTDVVSCMDPYPWDELDEEYEQPVIEFMVKWELAGSDALIWKT